MTPAQARAVSDAAHASPQPPVPDAPQRTYQMPSAAMPTQMPQQVAPPMPDVYQSVVRHIHELSSDGQTARILLGNRDFRDQLIRLIREQTALERSRAHSY